MPEEKKENKPKFDKQKNLSEKEREYLEFFERRKGELQETRQDQYGINLNDLWGEADRDYVPHRLGVVGKDKKAIVTDEEKGWRGALVKLGANNWQADIAQPNPFIKIQTALSILVDQNPSGVFSPASEKYEATNNLIKQLYQRSWEYAKSKQQLKLFVFNLAKYGWAVARTYPLKISRKSRQLTSYDEDDPSQNKYEEKEVVEFNDIFRENLDPRNTWIDDMAKPSNQFSIRDWCWRKVYAFDAAEEEFGKYPNWKFVTPGGNIDEVIQGKSSSSKEGQKREKDQVEIYFYENKIKDLFMVIANGTPVIIEPLPISDTSGLKRLSVWQAYWNLRHAECPYGIGVYEAMRYDNAMLDRIRNMTLDQLTLSIYKMWFYQGTNMLTETGDIKVSPGVGKQVLDPKNVTFLEVPGPGAEAWQGIEALKNDLEESSGITKTLQGESEEKTAYQSAVSRESALKRLKIPLDNILDALNEEGYITVSLIQLIYSIPETYRIADPELIDKYLKEIQGDPDLYERETTINEETGEVNDDFTARVFREFPLNMDSDEKGNLIETENTRFFRVKPKFLKWEGVINIKAQSILTPSKQVEKALDLEFYNMYIPLLSTLAQERMIAIQSGEDPSLDNLPHGKAAKNLAKIYEKSPEDLFPDSWLQEIDPQAQPLIIPAGGPIQGGVPPIQGQGGGAERLVTNATLPTNPQSMVGRLAGRFANLGRKFLGNQ